jgi:hypothetical protein
MLHSMRPLARAARWAAAAAVVLTLPSRAVAWGGDGHQIVALIAEERLTPEARRAVADLLGPGNHISDAEVANWADQVRRERRDTGPWHYVDIPLECKAYDPGRDGKGGNNVVDRLVAFEAVLADARAPKEARAEALRFVVHLVGDLHQPLHCADRNGDKGGNGRLVFFPGRGRAVNLHQTWDSLVLLRHRGTARVLDYAVKLNAAVSTAQAEQWQAGAPEAWANEAHEVAAKVVYAGVPADGPPPRLDAVYLAKAAQVTDEQLQKAGVRLAAVLNRAAASRAEPRS